MMTTPLRHTVSDYDLGVTHGRNETLEEVREKLRALGFHDLADEFQEKTA